MIRPEPLKDARSSPSLVARGLIRKGRPASSISRKLVQWMKADALPFWAGQGWDEHRGGFHERFRFDRTADHDSPRRLRVQWRQIYVLSHASLLGWHDGLKLALKGLEHCIQRGWGRDGAPGFVHLLNPDGSIADPKRDAYDHAFAILALSWLARASGDSQVRALLDLVLNFVDEALTDEAGFLRESLPPSLPRRQNPHMHMFEAMLALVETLQHPEGMLRAARYRRMLDKAFVDRTSNLLVEFFDDRFQPQRDEAGHSLVEPGHMAEWVWLLRKYERLSGGKPSPMGTHLLGASLRLVEPEYGFLIDESNTAGRITLASRRLWPQTELIKAWLAQAETGADGADRAAESLIEALLATYLSGPFRGGWYDRYDASGEIAADHVPASSFYHIFVAAAESERLLGS